MECFFYGFLEAVMLVTLVILGFIFWDDIVGFFDRQRFSKKVRDNSTPVRQPDSIPPKPQSQVVKKQTVEKKSGGSGAQWVIVVILLLLLVCCMLGHCHNDKVVIAPVAASTETPAPLPSASPQMDEMDQGDDDQGPATDNRPAPVQRQAQGYAPRQYQPQGFVSQRQVMPGYGYPSGIQAQVLVVKNHRQYPRPRVSPRHKTFRQPKAGLRGSSARPERQRGRGDCKHRKPCGPYNRINCR